MKSDFSKQDNKELIRFTYEHGLHAMFFVDISYIIYHIREHIFG